MKSHKKKQLKDSELQSEDLDEASFEQHELFRVYAVDLTFEDVSFKQSIVNECYFRNCIFKNCDFTGASIRATNFQGSEFTGCTFNYTSFKETAIGIDPLGRNLPGWENLKMQLAKNLRMNYASIGDYDGVNFAIRIELDATMEHLHKAAFSKEAYYRSKAEYSGLGRLKHIARYLWFVALDKLWGNGERPAWMLISVPLLLCILAVLIAMISGQGFREVVGDTLFTFVVGGTGVHVGSYGAVLVNLLRVVVIGLFISSLVRRLSRR